MGVEQILVALALEPVGTDRYCAPNAQLSHPVVFGGQLLAQAIVAAHVGHDDKSVKTVHTVFARAAAHDAPVEITVDRMHTGRAFASSTVTISQGDRLCTRSIVLLSADEPDLIRHGDVAPPMPAPEASPEGTTEVAGWELRIVDGVDVDDPEPVGPAVLDVWCRFVGAPGDLLTSQALLAFASDGFLIGTAMRPHAGVGQAQAHVTLSTGVISHTLTFHEPFDAGQWLLLDQRSPYAGRGRSHGRGEVFTLDGQLVASFVQDSMIRAMPSGEPRTM